MGNTVEQWRSSAGRWGPGRLRGSCVTRNMFRSCPNTSDGAASVPSLNFFNFIVLAALLVISGIEMNPGPGTNDMTDGPEQRLREQMEQKLQQLQKEIEKKLIQRRDQINMEYEIFKNQLQKEFQKTEQQLEFELKLHLQQEKLNQKSLGQSSGSHPLHAHRGQVYRRISSRVNTKGPNYEIKMGALLFLRGINSRQDFCLYSNVAGVGKFDDLVFIYKEKVQSSLGDFSVPQLFQSYPEVQNWITEHERSVENAELVLFTNKALRTNSESLDGQHSILSTGGSVFHFTEDKESEMYSLFQDLEEYISLLCDEDTGALTDRIEQAERKIKNTDILRKLGELKSDPRSVAKEKHEWRHTISIKNTKFFTV